MSLQEKKCVSCEGNIPPLGEKEWAPLLVQIPGWEVQEKKLHKQFAFKDFVAIMKFLNTVAAIAEQEGHHPDFSVHYNKVIFDIWTHAINGLSENDFILAAKIEKIA